MQTEQELERVAAAIDAASRYDARYNDWTSDHVPGLPIEVFEIIDGCDERIVARFPADLGEAETLRRFVRRQRAIAALGAMAWSCAARKQGTAGGNDAADCDWPTCGCDPSANKVVEALHESGWRSPDEVEAYAKRTREQALREAEAERKLGG